MVVRTYGQNAVDWEQRVDLDRLRRERLERLDATLERSELGALLTFDFANIRYMTSTHIGTWAMDKLIRFALLPRGGEPIVWDFGSAAKPVGVDLIEMPVLAALHREGLEVVDGQQVFLEARRIKSQDEIGLLA